VIEEKMNVYKVTRPDSGTQFCVYRKWSDVESEFDGADWGDTIHVELMSMTEKELEALPDFEGW
jgi:hypothetical protein